METFDQQKYIDRSATSLYFSDFPEDMWKEFGFYGKVVDVFVPAKRAKNGNGLGL